MTNILSAVRDGGPIMVLLLPAGIGLLFVTFVFVGSRLRGRRIPGAVWFLPPAAMSLLGFAGFLAGHRLTMKASAAAAPEMEGTMIASGTAVAMLPDQLGLAFCAVALAMATAGVAVAVGHEGRALTASLARPATALVLGLLGCVGIVLVAGDAAPKVVPVMSACLLAVAGAVGWASWRTPDAAHAHLVDDAGFVAASGVALLVVVTQLLVSLDSALMYRAIAAADPELHAVLQSGGLGAIASTVAVGIVASLFAAMMIPVAIVRRDAGSRHWGRGLAIAGVAAGVLFLRLAGSLSA